MFLPRSLQAPRSERPALPHQPSSARRRSPGLHRGLLGLAALAALALPLGGCGELSAIDGTDGTGGSSIPAEVEAAFVDSCATPGCHDATSRAGQLSLAAADLESLVGKPSTGSSLPQVEIGNIQGSYLAIKMLPDDVLNTNGLERSGGRMPPTGDFTNPDNATILAWIAGAEFPDDGGTGGTGSTGSTSETDGTGSTDGTDGTDSTGSTGDGMLTFDDVWPILSLCGCHIGGTPDLATNGNLTFTDMDAYAKLVGAPSPSLPELNLIEPSEPENSYLMHKLKDTQADVGGAGTQMPLGGLDPADIQLIEDWILAGAPE